MAIKVLYRCTHRFHIIGAEERSDWDTSTGPIAWIQEIYRNILSCKPYSIVDDQKLSYHFTTNGPDIETYEHIFVKQQIAGRMEIIPMKRKTGTENPWKWDLHTSNNHSFNPDRPHYYAWGESATSRLEQLAKTDMIAAIKIVEDPDNHLISKTGFLKNLTEKSKVFESLDFVMKNLTFEQATALLQWLETTVGLHSLTEYQTLKLDALLHMFELRPHETIPTLQQHRIDPSTIAEHLCTHIKSGNRPILGFVSCLQALLGWVARLPNPEEYRESMLKLLELSTIYNSADSINVFLEHMSLEEIFAMYRKPEYAMRPRLLTGTLEYLLAQKQNSTDAEIQARITRWFEGQLLAASNEAPTDSDHFVCLLETVSRFQDLITLNRALLSDFYRYTVKHKYDLYRNHNLNIDIRNWMRQFPTTDELLQWRTESNLTTDETVFFDSILTSRSRTAETPDEQRVANQIQEALPLRSVIGTSMDFLNDESIA